MRDANGTRFLPLIGPRDLAPRAPGLRWDPDLRALRLAKSAMARLPQALRTDVLAAREAAPFRVLDGFGQQGRLAPDGLSVEVLIDGAWEKVRDREGAPLAPAAGRFTALALGGGAEARLALLFDNGAGAQGLQVFHLRHRWPVDRPGETRADLPAPGRLLAAAPDGTVWVATRTELLALAGQPLPQDYRPEAARFEPVTVTRRGLRILRRIALPGGEDAIALAVDGAAAWLLRDRGAAPQEVWRRPLDRPDAAAAWQALPLPPHGPGAGPFFADLGLLPEGRLALLAPADAADAGFAQRDCAVFLHAGPALAPAGERWPMLAPPEARFVATAEGEPAYATADGPRRFALLRHPAHPVLAATPLVPLDGEEPETVWHRLHLDAAIPPGCGIALWARAAQDSLPQDTAALLAMAVGALAAEPGVASLDAAALRLLRDRARVAEDAAWQALAALPEASLTRLAGMNAAGIAALDEDRDPALRALAPQSALLAALAGDPLRRLLAASPALRRAVAG
ncbi:hypothetical protein E2C05_04085, partial [Paracraurococcus ruber]